MFRFPLALLALLIPLTAIAEPPAQPDSAKKTYRWKDFEASYGTTIEQPNQLIAWNFERRQKVWGRKYFDEQGRVFNHRQVHLIVQTAVLADGCDPCLPHLIDFERHNAAQQSWAVASATSQGAMGGVATAFMLHHGLQAERALGRSAHAYSTR